MMKRISLAMTKRISESLQIAKGRGLYRASRVTCVGPGVPYIGLQRMGPSMLWMLICRRTSTRSGTRYGAVSLGPGI